MDYQNDDDDLKDEEKEKKLSEPQNISRYFGKFQNPKLWQFQFKRKITPYNTTLKVKGNQVKWTDSFLTNWQGSLEFKKNDTKLLLMSYPFSNKPSKYQMLLNSSFKGSRFEVKCNERGQGNIKYVENLQFMGTPLKLQFQSVNKFKNFNFQVLSQYFVEFFIKKQHNFSKFQNVWKIIGEQRLKLKIGNSNNSQVKAQQSVSMTKNQHKKKSKILYDYRIFAEQKFNAKINKTWQYKFLLAGTSNLIHQNARFELNVENSELKKWDLKYYNKFFEYFNFGFSYGNKGWEALVEKNLKWGKVGFSKSSKQTGFKLEFNPFKNYKFEALINKKNHQLLGGLSFTANL